MLLNIEAGDDYPVFGRIVVLGAAAFLVFLFAYTYVGFDNRGTVIGAAALCAFLVTELVWGTKWVRWVIAPLFLFWAVQGLVWWSAYSWLGHVLHIIEACFGLAFLFSRQVRCYMAIRKSTIQSRIKRVRYIPVAVLGVVMTVVVVLDVIKVVRK